MKKDKSMLHFWDVPNKSNYVILDDIFLDKFIAKLMPYSQAGIEKLTGVSKSVAGRTRRKEKDRIRIDTIVRLNKIVKCNFGEIEKNILWIGSPLSRGIKKPNLPFNFKSREAARVLAAICNDGWISDGAYYSNFCKELRGSIIKDTLHVFGGDENTVKEWVKSKDQYLAFPSIIRDVLVVITEFKGIKAENNPSIPSFILESKESMLGWIEQTIADEGNVRYHPETFRRAIVWRRSIDVSALNIKGVPLNGSGLGKFSKKIRSKVGKQKCNLIEDEIKILKLLGVYYRLYNLDLYSTKYGKIRTRWHIGLTKKENLIKLAGIITIPDPKKQATLISMVNSY